jgi:dephospho-CoA kinase
VGTNGRKPLIGILGGIAAGKSTAAAEFAKLGCKVVDADRIAHDLLGKKRIKEEITAAFGPGIIDRAGRIDRAALAVEAFSSPEKYALLNGILHPPVLTRIERLIGRYNRLRPVKAIVLDVPLLAEKGLAERCDRLVFVDCRPQLRLERAKNADFPGKNQIRARENFQISLDRKKAVADNVIDNNSDLSALARQVAEFFALFVDKG